MPKESLCVVVALSAACRNVNNEVNKASSGLLLGSRARLWFLINILSDLIEALHVSRHVSAPYNASRGHVTFANSELVPSTVSSKALPYFESLEALTTFLTFKARKNIVTYAIFHPMQVFFCARAQARAEGHKRRKSRSAQYLGLTNYLKSASVRKSVQQAGLAKISKNCNQRSVNLSCLSNLSSSMRPTKKENSYHLGRRLLSLSGDIVENPGPMPSDPTRRRDSEPNVMVTMYNVRGLSEEKKLRHLINSCYKESRVNVDNIFCFQETYIA